MLKKLKLLILAGIFIFLNLNISMLLLADGVEKGEIPVTSISSEGIQFFIQAREAFEMGRNADAITLLDKAIQKDPSMAMAYLLKAKMAGSDSEMQKNIELALQNKNRISDGEKILIEMESAGLKGDIDKRFELSKKLVSLFPESPRALLILAGEYQGRNSIVKARDLAIQAIMAAPDSPLGYRALGESYMLNEPVDFTLAVKYMKKFTEMRPKEAVAFISLGDAYRANLSLDFAREAYTKAIQLDPESVIAYSKRGYIYTYSGSLDNAREDFGVARTLASRNQQHYRNPDYTIKTVSKGAEPLSENIDHAQGNRYHLEGPKSDQYFCCTLIGMMHGSYSLQGRSLNCCQGLCNNLVFESMPPDPEMVEANLTFVEAIRAMHCGDFELAEKKATEHARQVDSHRNPKKCEVYDYLMGNIFLKQQKYTRAVDFLEKAASENPYAKYDLGLAYMGLGDWQKSLTIFRDIAQCTSSSTYKPDIISNAENWERKLNALVVENQ